MYNHFSIAMTPEQEFAPYSSKRERNIVFFFVTVGIIALTYSIFYIIDFLPEKPDTTTEAPKDVVIDNASMSAVPETEVRTDEPAVENVSASATASERRPANVSASNQYPVRIIFDALDGREVAVLNPESSSVTALDSALLSGVVRHPDSASFREEGTIFILGHSSYLPNVKNKNYQAFNGIQKMKWGDTIRLRSKDTEYLYSVDRVYETKASGAEVQIQHDEAKLVLATCNSFATKDDRFIVEATLIDTYPIGSGAR